ncbi:ankyrin repeat-containing domain protein [Podospora australis]|uniref:Ankyrin repeat-containing domain protein n=1 Tax=Podospora australis TaxID=1536484 RepID=A0AAN6WLQ0_9PEZI|nr:ankyrin repeat-containing domain protein [Podospora australis]
MMEFILWKELCPSIPSALAKGAYWRLHSQIDFANTSDSPQWKRLVLDIVGRADIDDVSGSTPIHEAVLTSDRTQRLALLERALCASPGDINTLDGFKASPLQWAASRSDLEVMDVLYRWGADINVDCASGNRDAPLRLAVSSGSFDSVQWLIEHGVNTNVRAVSGVTPLVFSVMQGTTPASITAVLLANGAEPNATETGEGLSELHFLVGEFTERQWAVESTRKLKLLLQAGAEIDKRNCIGRSPLLDAAAYDDHRFVCLVLQHGASLQIIDNQCKGILHCVAEHATSQTMETLRLHIDSLPLGGIGIDPYLKSKEGLTAADYFKAKLEQVQSSKDGVGRPKGSSKPISEKDIEGWVLLMETVQGRYEGY